MRVKEFCTGLILAAVLTGTVVFGALCAGPAYPYARAEAARSCTSILLAGTGAKIAGSGANAHEGAVTIIDGGVYEIAGEADDLQLIVDAGKRAEITLRLNGASITNPDGPAIYVKKAASVVLEISDDTQNLLISGEKTELLAPSEDVTGGALYSKCDLTVTGEGALFVGGYLNNGVHGSDSLILQGGAITVEAVNHAVKGKDALIVRGGSLDAASGADGLHSDGVIEITDGSISVSAADDGIHADDSLRISGGTVAVIESEEGMEAVNIEISGGVISVKANDDGVNANGGASTFGRDRSASAKSASEETPLLRITGGNLCVDAQGDGLDSNGDLIIEGGSVIVDGPDNGGNGALDSGSENGGACRIDGGFALAVSASGMAESFDADSAQCAFCWEMSFSAGDEIILTDSSGTELFRHTAVRSGGTIVFSSPELKQSETYVLTVGENTEEIEMTEANVTNSKNFFSNPRGFGGMDDRGRHGFMRDSENDGNPPEMPDGGFPGNPPEMPDGTPPADAPMNAGDMTPQRASSAPDTQQP